MAKTQLNLHELDDWLLYGPKNAEIETIVRQLATECELRLPEIEGIIVQALRARLADEKAKNPR
tara:strand:- start:2412 stop:2603 length:192 start_codon:yes stop_codon:yes gene_type:complete